MIYLRGHRRDYDDWHSFGNPTWSYDEVLPYFRKSEHNINTEFVNHENGKYHSDKGMLKVGLFRPRNETDTIEGYFVAAGKELGYEYVDDFNTDTVLGFGRIQGTVYNGRRQSTAKSFLIPAKDRPNLHIIKYAHATKIEIDDNGKATGVEFVYKENKKLLAKVNKEIVVSAGAISSPQLLMLSGIGPDNELKKHKITVKQNLAVGKSLQDHMIVRMYFNFNRSKNNQAKIDNLQQDAVEFYLHNKGPLTGIGITDLVGYINTKSPYQLGYPDIEYHHFAYNKNSTSFQSILNAFGYSEDVQKILSNENEKNEVAGVSVVLLNPSSKGSITLNSADPFDKPIIDANYLAEEDDWQTTLDGVKYQYSQINTNAFKQNEGAFIRLPLPECDELPFASDNYFKCYINQTATTVYHPAGTCKMGPSSDKDAVVDPRLRVYGVSNLRVADASIMPKIVSANTNAASIMIGEKCADFIKEDWNVPRDEL